MITFDMKSSVIPLIQKKTIFKIFKNHKLKYIMTYEFYLLKFFIHLN